VEILPFSSGKSYLLMQNTKWPTKNLCSELTFSYSRLIILVNLLHIIIKRKENDHWYRLKNVLGTLDKGEDNPLPPDWEGSLQLLKALHL
jgi:hypothetical protein